MSGLNLSENIARLRHEREITQEELADFVGVTKASVSKWESGKSTPDILLLPLLASFFGVTVDELMGYEPQLAQEQIRRIYGELCEAFVEFPILEAFEKVRDYVRRFYSCYPFLLQVVVLYVNHILLIDDQEKRRKLLLEAERFCDHIIERCKVISIREDAVSLKAILNLQLGKAEEAIEMLKDLADPVRLSEQNEGVFIQAYLQAGELEKAKGYTQIRIYSHLLSLISDETINLSLYDQETERCEETIRRVKLVIELYSMDTLHPNTVAQFYYQAAVFHASKRKNEEALEELKVFKGCVDLLIKDPVLKGNQYFDRVEEWIERLPLGNMAPRDKRFIKVSTQQALLHPAFAALKEKEEFQKIFS